MIESKVMARSTRYSYLARPDLLLTEYRFHIHYMEKSYGKSGKILIAIQRSDQKLWLIRTVTLAWRDQTSSSQSIDSTSTIWKRASGNSCKILIAIQWSNQKLWPVRTVTLAWRDQTSSSPSIDSTSTIWKRASRNSCKILIAIQRSHQKLWPVRTVTLAWRDQTSSSPSINSTSTIWKSPLESPVKFWSRSNSRIKSYGLYEPLL